MCSRRNKPVLQAFIFLGLVASLGYFVYLYNTITFKLDRSERQLNKYVKHQKSLSAQLKVVYEHRARLEKSFEREKADHKKTKEELDDSKRNFFVNITRTKHETLNRFNSLETQHRMVKAKHEQLQVEYNRLQQQHVRLSAEHLAVHNQQVNAFNAMKGQKENEVLGLEAQISTLKRQVATWKRQYSTQHEEAEYYKGMHRSAQQEVEKHKATILGMYEKVKKRQSLFGTALNSNVPGINDLEKFVQSKIPHGHAVGNADAIPGHPQVTMPTRVPLKQDERGAGQFSEDVGRRRDGGKQKEEEVDDSDEDNEDTRQKTAQIPRTIPVTTTPPPVYVPPGPPADGVRPDVFRREQNRREETGYRSRGSQNTPIVLQDRSTQESLAVQLAATAQPQQVAPKPLTTKTHERVKRATVGEAEGDSKADSEGEQETEEQKVQRYLSHNADPRRQEQQQEHQQKQQQQQQQQQQEEQQREQNPDRSNREARNIPKDSERQQNPQINRDQKQNPLSRLNSNEGLSNLQNRDFSRETKQGDQSNAEQKRLKREEQFRRPIPKPGGQDKKKAGEEDSENVEPQDDGNNRGKDPNLQEEENDNEEDDAEEDKDERENTQEQRRKQDQGIPRPDSNKRANPAENTEGEQEEQEDTHRQPGAKLRGLRKIS